MTVNDKKVINCTCQGWLVHKKCKHAKKLTYEKLTLTPKQKQIQMKEAQRHGKKVAKIDSSNSAYRPVEEKLKESPAMQAFLDATS